MWAGFMLICAILDWGNDLLIRPVESTQQVKDLKTRLDMPNVDFIVYDSGYLTPIAFDNFTHILNECEQIELWGNPAHRKPAWDGEGVL